MSTDRITCETCGGTGVIVRTKPAPIQGCKLRSAVQTCEMRSFCTRCKGTGKAAPAAAPLDIAGHMITTPGFTPEGFDRAVFRSFDEGLRIEATDTAGVYLVRNPTHASAYATSRESCTCKAGTADRGCKHVARLLFELDICEGRYLPAPAITREAA